MGYPLCPSYWAKRLGQFEETLALNLIPFVLGNELCLNYQKNGLSQFRVVDKY